jgi:hypothetical protein
MLVHPRGVYRLRISCARRYPGLIRQCEIGRATKQGCVDVYSYSKHWPCLFPQHGPGRKHERKIELAGWQQDLVDVDPRPLVRGLLHSDGCRVLNWVNGTPYPRYHFSSASDDIRAIFGRACDALGIEWRPHNRRNLSVAKRGSVALLDAGGFDEPSTKRAAEALDKWGADRPTLVVLDADEIGALKSFRNIERVTVLDSSAVGVADVVGVRSLVISKTALDTIAERAKEG